MQPELADLLRRLQECAPAERIDLREPVLAFGASAVRPLHELATSQPNLGASIAAWLTVLATRDPTVRLAVISALRDLAANGSGPGAGIAADGLARLGASTEGGPKKPPTGSLPPSAGKEWPGFQEHEFGRNEGTRWRSADGRESLAPIVTRVLRGLDSDFISYGVERLPEIHFAVARRYKGCHEAGFTASKLVVYAHGPNEDQPDTPSQVVAGYYIEKGDGTEPFGDPTNARQWDWPLFMRALGRPAFQAALTDAMARHDLTLGDYPYARYRQSLGWRARVEDGSLVARDDKEREVASGWPTILELVSAVPPSTWIDLHIWQTWPAAEAIAGGQPFALREIAPCLVDLAALYLELLPKV